MAAPSAILRSASPRFLHPQTKGALKSFFQIWLCSSAGVKTSLSSMKSISSVSSTCASAKWPILHFAMTGIETCAWIPRIISGSLILEMPPSLRMSAGIRSNAITAQAPASSAIFACSALVTSIITPPFSISANPTFTSNVPLLIDCFLYSYVSNFFYFFNDISNNIIRCGCTGRNTHYFTIFKPECFHIS